uniref:Uncharacterized protein n=1 Tax=Arundo donax TaxID=35708 RepID=A0A0A9AB42_ARUDO
MQIFQEMHRI